MGREIKRVPENFDWPMDQIWHGFIKPEALHSKECPCCGGSGYNKETEEIAQTFYDNEGFGVTWTYQYNVAPDGTPATRPPWKVLGHTRRWSNKITQDEVQALVDKNRLYDFTHIFSDGTDGKERGWHRREDGYIPTAKEVNHWADHGMGHDGCNRWILIEARAKRLGVYGLCERCEGAGHVYHSIEQQKASEAWIPTEIPEGSWWQVWETVSEGSPVTPAFATAQELIDYLVEYGDAWDQKRGDGGWNRTSAENFVGSGWSPSMVLEAGEIKTAKNM